MENLNTYTDNSSEQARDIGRPFVSNIRRGIQTSTAYNRPPIPPSQTDLPQHLLYIGPAAAATEQRPCTLLGCNHCHQLNFFSIVYFSGLSLSLFRCCRSSPAYLQSPCPVCWLSTADTQSSIACFRQLDTGVCVFFDQSKDISHR